MMISEEDLEILAHRDAHFGGKFSIMLSYYATDGKGVLLDETRIKELAQIEDQLPEPNLGETQKVYQQLRQLCEVKNPKNPLPHLIADLILSEVEDEQETIDALVAKGADSVPYLIDLLNTPTFADPLYPGYGQALAVAASCLGKIGDPRAITPLFEMLSHYDTHTDQAALDALIATGESAKSFLIRVVKGKPITRDTENAALVLSAFPPDPKIAETCLALLQDEEALTQIPLSTYLAISCSTLDPSRFQPIIDNPKTPHMTKEELGNFLV